MHILLNVQTEHSTLTLEGNTSASARNVGRDTTVSQMAWQKWWVLKIFYVTDGLMVVFCALVLGRYFLILAFFKLILFLINFRIILYYYIFYHYYNLRKSLGHVPLRDAHPYLFPDELFLIFLHPSTPIETLYYSFLIDDYNLPCSHQDSKTCMSIL